MKWLVLALLLASSPAVADDYCQQVRDEYGKWWWAGKPAIRAWLRANGHSRDEIRRAEKCLK